MKKNTLFIIAIILCSLIPISSHSLWLDEAWTITEYGFQTTFKGLLYSIIDSPGGDCQFPGYNIYIWGWIKLFGASEISARAANLPFFYASLIFCFLYLPRSKNFKMGFLLLISLSPLIWFYLNESRYIISVFSFSLISFVSVLMYFEGDERNQKFSFYMFLISITLGTAFMMLYIFYLIPLAVLFYYYLQQKGDSFKNIFIKWKIPLFITAFLFILMGIYYLYTIIIGSGGTRLNPGIKNIVFVLYDYLGFAGIGPPRDSLREKQLIEIGSIYFVGVVILSLIYAVFLYLIIHNFKVAKEKFSLYGFSGFVIGLLFFFIFAKYYQFKFLSRHLIFFYPPFLFFSFTLFYTNILQNYKKLSTYLVIIFFATFLYSDFNIRFNKDYQKMDTSNAYNITVKEFQGHKIMWLDDRHAFEYYAYFKNESKYIKKKNVIIISKAKNDLTLGKPENIKQIDSCINKEKHIIVLGNRYDYDKKVENFLLSKDYKIVYHDKDYTMYK